MPQPFITDIMQICLLVKDFDRAVHALNKQLGIGPFKCWDNRPPTIFDVERKNKPADWRMKLGVAWMGHVQFEVIQPTAGASMYRDYLDLHGDGLHHLLLEAKGLNLAKSRARMEAADFSVGQSAKLNLPIQLGPLALPPVPQFMRGAFNTQFFYADTAADLGTVLEFSQLPPGIPFRLGVSLGKPDYWLPAGSTKIDSSLPNRFIDEITKIGMLVRDAEAMSAAYENRLGVGGWQKQTRSVGDARFHVASVQLGKTTFELVQPLEGQSALHDRLQKKGEGIHILGVRATADAVARFRQADAKFALAGNGLTYLDVPILKAFVEINA